MKAKRKSSYNRFCASAKWGVLVLSLLISFSLVPSKEGRADDSFPVPYADINIDGKFDDWVGVPVATTDRVGDIYGVTHIDIENAYIARDDKYLYFRIQLAGSFNEIERPWFQTFFQTDPLSLAEGQTGIMFAADFNGSLLGTGSIWIMEEAVMTYPPSAGFAMVGGKNVEFKVLQEHVSVNIDNMKFRAGTYDYGLAVGDGTPPVLIKMEGAPGAPVLRVTIDGTKVTFSWTAVFNTDGYIFVFALPGFSHIDWFDLGTITDFSVDLWDGFALYVAVVAYNRDGISPLSNIEYFEIDLSADPKDIDNDGDGYTEKEGDCDDVAPNINPDGTEICDDGKDNDCDGDTDKTDSDCESSGISCCKCICTTCTAESYISRPVESCLDICKQVCETNFYCGSYVSSRPCE